MRNETRLTVRVSARPHDGVRRDTRRCGAASIVGVDCDALAPMVISVWTVRGDVTIGVMHERACAACAAMAVEANATEGN